MKDDFDKYEVRNAVELIAFLTSLIEAGTSERTALTAVRDLLERVHVQMRPGLLDYKISIAEALRHARAAQ